MGWVRKGETQISKCIGSQLVTHTTCNPYSVFPLQSSELASVPFSLLLTWPPEGWVSVLGDCGGGGGGGGGYYCLLSYLCNALATHHFSRSLCVCSPLPSLCGASLMLPGIVYTQEPVRHDSEPPLI